jgi:hypothetical protein
VYGGCSDATGLLDTPITPYTAVSTGFFQSLVYRQSCRHKASYSGSIQMR